MSKLIYVVDDESNIRTMMQLFLENEGFTVETFKDGQEACQAFSAKEPDMLILDIMMPGIDGLSLCTYFRRQSHVPIIFVSAKDTPLDRVMGITLGSDDYITKPFSPKELVLRVNNVIKRVYKNDSNRIMVDGYELDEEQRKVFDGGKEIDLTTKEFDLLMMFIKNKGMAFNRDKILTNVWEENYFGSDRVVDDTLRRLRKKLPNLNIHTIYGYGYRLG